MIGCIFYTKFGVIPKIDTCINTVVGKGISCPQIDKPSNEDINKYH